MSKVKITVGGGFEAEAAQRFGRYVASGRRCRRRYASQWRGYSLALQAAEQGVSLNRLSSAELEE